MGRCFTGGAPCGSSLKGCLLLSGEAVLRGCSAGLSVRERSPFLRNALQDSVQVRTDAHGRAMQPGGCA